MTVGDVVISSHLERSGAPIGAFDLLIAAHALSLGCTLISNNLHEFSRVPNLALANWVGD
jgi:tRNA(fMet)-specific endonuclease VapC